MYFVKIDQVTLGKERDLPISPMEPTSSISKVLRTHRSNHCKKVFCKKRVLENFANITR